MRGHRTIGACGAIALTALVTACTGPRVELATPQIVEAPAVLASRQAPPPPCVPDAELAPGAVVGSSATRFATADAWVFGDSITAQHADTLAAAHDGVVAIGAVGSRTTAATADALAAAVAAHGAPPVVVMAAGTNDIANPDSMAGSVQAVRSSLPATTRLLWVTVYAAHLPAEDIATVNTSIGSVPGVELVDWHAAAVAHPEYLADGVHTTCTGRQAWVALVTTAIG